MSGPVVAAAGGRALWYLTRGSGATTLVLLTVSAVLGIADVRRWTSPRVPRFVVDGLHRTVSLLVVALVAVHVVTSIIDSYAPIRLIDAVVPFVSAYRPVWVGLGALAFDLLLALVVTSLLRARLGARSWRAVHWLAYACWPVAFVHGLGTGSDIRGGWMLDVSVICAAAMALAVSARLAGGWPQRAGLRVGLGAALVAFAVAVMVWAPSGPLARGWARRAGTPVAQLGSVQAAGIAGGVVPSARRPAGPPAAPGAPVTARLTGLATTANDGATNAAEVRLALALDRGSLRSLVVRLRGTPLAGGGIALRSGDVTLGTPSSADRYRGSVSALSGGRLSARLRGPGSGTLEIDLVLSLDSSTGRVGGIARITPLDGASA